MTMAGEWIKMRVFLGDHPKVMQIACATDLEQDMVVGKLQRLWSWADQNTTDGNAVGVTFALLDRLVGVTGFCDALEAVGWLVPATKSGDKPLANGVSFVDYEAHNGKTGKRRAVTQKRVAKHKRNGNANGNAVVTPKVTQPALPERYPEQEQEQERDIKGARASKGGCGGNGNAASVTDALASLGLPEAKVRELAPLAGDDFDRVVEEWHANHHLFHSPHGALAFRLREGKWPTDDVVSPSKKASDDAAQKLRIEMARKERDAFRIIRSGRANGKWDTDINRELEDAGTSWPT